MQNIRTIAGRQFRSYFNGPVAYIVGVLLLLALGFLFWSTFFLEGITSVRSMFRWLSMLSVFAVPAMTMGLIAEEKRTGTMELLITFPVRDAEVIFGKFLGVLGFYAVLLLLTLPYPISVSFLGDLDWGPVATGYLGLLLQGAAMLGIGLMASSFTDNQIVALFSALFGTFFLWVIHYFVPLVPRGLSEVVDWFSFGYHFQSMGRGVIDLRDVIYFISIAALSLSVAFRSLESRRWS